jgi:hypothetical protein
MTPELIKKSFEKTGIHPFNPYIFPPESFAPSKIYSCKAHVPESFPPEICSSPIPFDTDASDNEYHPSSDLDIGDHERTSDNDNQCDSITVAPQIPAEEPFNIEQNSDCDNTDIEPEDLTQPKDPEGNSPIDAPFSSTSSSSLARH